MNPPDAPELGTALRAYALAELDAALAGLQGRGIRLHEGVHRARKALRRCRAVLALLGDDAGAQLVDHGLRRVNRELSSLRDAHALVETLDRLIARQRTQEDRARLLQRAARAARAQRSARTREVQQADPGLAEVRARLQVLRAALQGVAWALPPTILAAQMDRAAQRAAKAAERAFASTSDRDWHRWRRRLRRISQQERALAAAHADAGGASLFRRSVAEQLGVAQDLTLLHEHCGAESPFREADRDPLRRFAEQALVRQRRRIAAVVRAAG